MTPLCYGIFYELPRRFSLFAAQKDIQIGKQRYFLHFCNRQFVVAQYFWRLISWEFPTWKLAIGRQEDKNQYSKLSKSWQTQWSGELLMGGRLLLMQRDLTPYRSNHCVNNVFIIARQSWGVKRVRRLGFNMGCQKLANTYPYLEITTFRYSSCKYLSFCLNFITSLGNENEPKF